MLIASKVKENKKDDISAVFHVDGSARVQTVNHNSNRKFYELLKEFYNLTINGFYLTLNFNIKRSANC